jgi:multiple sugar transport system permease protein
VGGPAPASFAWRLIAPVLAVEGFLVIAPLLIGVWFSLHQADYFQLGGFRGLRNFADVISDPVVAKSLVVTATFTIFSLFFTFILGFALALWLEADTRTNVAVRAVVLVPYVIAMVVGSLLMKWIFSSEGGALSLMLQPFGLGGFSVLSHPDTAMAALVCNALWRDNAFAMVLLLAGLKGIPTQLYAAAQVDGAGAMMRFWHLTLPLMRIPILITLIRLVIHLMNELTFALVLTNGGPNSATLTTGLALYNMGFVDFRVGQGSAFAIMLLAVNLCLIGILLVLFRDRQRGVA